MKKRVALVGNSAKTMYIFRGELMKDLIQAGYDVTVIAPLDRDLSIFESDQISFIELPMECRDRKSVV